MLVYEAGPELDKLLYDALGWQAISGLMILKPDGSIALGNLSTTWIGMGQLVEEMQKRGYLIEIDQFQWDLYNVRWRHAATGAWTRWMRFESLPHAVAIATLSALRGENRDVEAEF